MPVVLPAHPGTSFFSQNEQSLREVVGGWGWPAFRARQLMGWVYGKLVADPEQMTDLSKRDRQELGERMAFANAAVVRKQDSNDGTLKLLLTWPDGKNAEAVMIPDGERRTACVSSQVGCPVGCKFCASGVNGVQGNLASGQIVEQIFVLNQLLATRAERITNIVFMGMGEPMANYAAVMDAVRILHEPNGFNIGARRITISTVGVPTKIRALAEEGLPVNLALSLHAPNEPLRRELIPWAEHFDLDAILDACRYYFDQTGREITLEYILLHDVNDRPEHARELARLCKTMRANV